MLGHGARGWVGLAGLAMLVACGAESFRPGAGTGGGPDPTGSGGTSVVEPPTGSGGENGGGAGGAISGGDSGGSGGGDVVDAAPADAPPADVPVTGTGGAGGGGSGGTGGATVDAPRDVPPEAPRVACVAGADTDGDGLDDCAEANDDDPWTDRTMWNGFSVTVKANGSTGTCADLADYNKMEALFQTPTEVKTMSGGWSFDTDQDRYFDPAYGFKPSWTTTVAGAFRVRYRGVINFKTAGQQCFRVDVGSTGGAQPDACGQIYVNAGPGKTWLAQNGYTAATDDGEACVNLPAGTYPIDIVFQYGNPNHHHKLAVSYCAGGGAPCIPSQPLSQQMVRPPSCISDAACSCEFFGGHAYRFCKVGRPFAGAGTDCVAHAMHLIRLDSDAENRWAYDVTVAQGMSATWIGASDAMTEGDWRWADGTSFWSGTGPTTGGAPVGGLYNAWDVLADEPNAVGNEDCAGYWYDRGTWSDLTCTDSMSYICESN